MTLKVGNLSYEVQLDLTVASTAPIPLPRLTSLYDSSLSTNIYWIPDLLPGLRQIACNHRGIIQTRCEYHGGFLGHFSWTDARFSRIGLSLWKMMSSIIFSLEHLQNDEWLKLLGKTQILSEKLIHEGCWPVKSFLLWILAIFLHFVLGSHLILERNMSFLCLLVVLKAWDVYFNVYFDKKILIKLQHAKSRIIDPKIKSILIVEMTRYLKITWGDQANFEPHKKWTTHHIAKF